MPLAAVALILAAAVAHASWNYLAKGARMDAGFTFVFTAVASLVYLPVAAVAYVAARPDVSWQVVPLAAVAGLLHIAYFLLLGQGYRAGDLSLVYPLARGSGPALSVLAAIVLLGDRPSPLALAGSALVVVGILVMAWSPGQGSDGRTAVSIAFALATGVVIATYTLWDSQAVGSQSPVVYGAGIEVARLALLAPALVHPEFRSAVLGAARSQWRAAVGVGVLSPGAYILVLAALTLAPVSYVAPAREISIFFGAVLGWRMLGEADAGRRLAGAGAIVGGVFALAIG
jgi:drug/metabolite transporter (DMT)-like permease